MPEMWLLRKEAGDNLIYTKNVYYYQGMHKNNIRSFLFLFILFFIVPVSHAVAAPSIVTTVLQGTGSSVIENPLLHPISIELTANEAVNWVSLKIENQSDTTIYKTFGSGVGCVDDSLTCLKTWNGTLSHGSLVDGVYQIKVHIKNALGEEFFEYVPFSITVDTEAPVFVVPGDIIAEATSTAGAFVPFAVTANDVVDGPTVPSCEPTANSLFAFGTTTVSCTATDSQGNATSTSFSVSVRDTTSPTLALLGNTALTLTKGDTFSEPGYTASDSVGGDLSLQVVVSGSVDTALVGEYTLRYSVSDSAGNTANEMVRTVSVVDPVVVEPVILPPAPPVVTAPGAIAIFPSGGGAANPLPGASVSNESSMLISESQPTTEIGRVLGVATYFFRTDLGYGTVDPAVSELQKVLVAKGYSIPDAVTNYFGPQTQAALKAFQKDAGIRATGYLGPLTREALTM